MPELIAIKKLPIFKAGRHTDSEGKSRDITEQDLDGMLENLRGDFSRGYRPPVVLGHPKMDDPRYGDFLDMEKKNGILYADVGVIPELQESLKKGQFPDRSIRIAKQPDGTYRIKHLGLLGVVPPAVKDLPAYHFSGEEDSESVTIEFSDYKDSIVGSVFRRLREWLIEKFDPDTADRIVGNWEIEELQLQPAFSENIQEEVEGMGKELEEKLREKEQEASDLAEKAKLTEEENSRLKQELEQERSEKRRKDFASFCESDAMKAKITPAIMPAVLDLMEFMSGTESYEFSEGDGKKAKAPLDVFREVILPNLKDQVEFSEAATKGACGDKKDGKAYEYSGAVDEERLEIHEKAVDLCEKDSGLTYVDAVRRVMKEKEGK